MTKEIDQAKFEQNAKKAVEGDDQALREVNTALQGLSKEERKAVFDRYEKDTAKTPGTPSAKFTENGSIEFEPTVIERALSPLSTTRKVTADGNDQGTGRTGKAQAATDLQSLGAGYKNY